MPVALGQLHAFCDRTSLFQMGDHQLIVKPDIITMPAALVTELKQGRIKKILSQSTEPVLL